MRGKRDWLWPSLLLMAFLHGCAAQPVAVVAPCPEIPPLPEHLQTAQFPAALKKLNETLMRHGEPALPIVQP